MMKFLPKKLIELSEQYYPDQNQRFAITYTHGKHTENSSIPQKHDSISEHFKNYISESLLNHFSLESEENEFIAEQLASFYTANHSPKKSSPRNCSGHHSLVFEKPFKLFDIVSQNIEHTVEILKAAFPGIEFTFHKEMKCAFKKQLEIIITNESYQNIYIFLDKNQNHLNNLPLDKAQRMNRDLETFDQIHCIDHFTQRLKYDAENIKNLSTNEFCNFVTQLFHITSHDESSSLSSWLCHKSTLTSRAILLSLLAPIDSKVSPTASTLSTLIRQHTDKKHDVKLLNNTDLLMETNLPIQLLWWLIADQYNLFNPIQMRQHLLNSISTLSSSETMEKYESVFQEASSDLSSMMQSINALMHHPFTKIILNEQPSHVKDIIRTYQIDISSWARFSLISASQSHRIISEILVLPYPFDLFFKQLNGVAFNTLYQLNENMNQTMCQTPDLKTDDLFLLRSLHEAIAYHIQIEGTHFSFVSLLDTQILDDQASKELSELATLIYHNLPFTHKFIPKELKAPSSPTYSKLRSSHTKLKAPPSPTYSELGISHHDIRVNQKLKSLQHSGLSCNDTSPLRKAMLRYQGQASTENKFNSCQLILIDKIKREQYKMCMNVLHTFSQPLNHEGLYQVISELIQTHHVNNVFPINDQKNDLYSLHLHVFMLFLKHDFNSHLVKNKQYIINLHCQCIEYLLIQNDRENYLTPVQEYFKMSLEQAINKWLSNTQITQENVQIAMRLAYLPLRKEGPTYFQSPSLIKLFCNKYKDSCKKNLGMLNLYLTTLMEQINEKDSMDRLHQNINTLISTINHITDRIAKQNSRKSDPFLIAQYQWQIQIIMQTLTYIFTKSYIYRDHIDNMNDSVLVKMQKKLIKFQKLWHMASSQIRNAFHQLFGRDICAPKYFNPMNTLSYHLLQDQLDSMPTIILIESFSHMFTTICDMDAMLTYIQLKIDKKIFHFDKRFSFYPVYCATRYLHYICRQTNGYVEYFHPQDSRTLINRLSVSHDYADGMVSYIWAYTTHEIENDIVEQLLFMLSVCDSSFFVHPQISIFLLNQLPSDSHGPKVLQYSEFINVGFNLFALSRKDFESLFEKHPDIRVSLRLFLTRFLQYPLNFSLLNAEGDTFLTQLCEHSNYTTFNIFLKSLNKDEHRTKRLLTKADIPNHLGYNSVACILQHPNTLTAFIKAETLLRIGLPIHSKFDSIFIDKQIERFDNLLIDHNSLKKHLVCLKTELESHRKQRSNAQPNLSKVPLSFPSPPRVKRHDQKEKSLLVEVSSEESSSDKSSSNFTNK